MKSTFKDDIGVKYGKCEDQNFSSVACDFEEKHICGYQSDPTQRFNWLRRAGPVSSQTVPTVDVRIKLKTYLFQL